ncbi:DNA polymerase [Schinkia azotoformans]|uniref:DNA polymerase n=1 Tax=Schinkia azotoformans TaxID=1454 RepID=UPI002E1FAE76|nr:DNA polymerase [Schinkia azotoformans]MED4353713.1 DNA polymerase [Schinkia azotoformans]
MRINLLEESDKIEHTIAWYQEFLNNPNNRVYISLNKIHEFEDIYKKELQIHLADTQEYINELLGRTVSFDPNSQLQVKKLFLKELKIPYELLLENGKVSISLEVLELLTLIYDFDFLNSLMHYRKALNNLQYLRQFNRQSNFKLKNIDGHDLLVVVPKYTRHRTNRFNTSNPPIQNIPKSLKGIITCPNGYKIVQADSSQIEPRLFYSLVVKDYLINEYLIDIADTYEALITYCLDRVGIPQESNLRKKILEERRTYKIIINAAHYGAGRNYLTSVDREIGEIVFNHLVNHPKRQEYVNICKAIFQKRNYVKTGFGDNIEVDKTDIGKMALYGINYTIQGTSSALTAIGVKAITQDIEEMNWQKYVKYSFNKHDEDIYVVHENKVDYVSERVRNSRSFNCNEWHTIDADVKIGDYYS